MSFTFEGPIKAAEQWLPFAIGQRKNYLINGIKSTNITPAKGVLIMIREHHIHIVAAPNPKISAGGHHSIVISDGMVWVSGSHVEGQLGLGFVPDDINGLATINVFTDTGIKATEVAAGEYHSLAISEGTAWSTGDNVSGQLGRDASPEVTSFYNQFFSRGTYALDTWGDTGVEAVDIFGGSFASYLIAKTPQIDGTEKDILYTCGYGGGAMLEQPEGQGLDNAYYFISDDPINPIFNWRTGIVNFYTSGRSFKKVVHGYSNAFEILALMDGVVYAGFSARAEVIGVTGIPAYPYAQTVNTGVAADDISMGKDFSLIIRNGEIWARGKNTAGQLGLGDTAYRLNYTNTGVKATAIASGVGHSLCISNGVLMGTGYNYSGQLGLGGLDTVNTFTKIPGGEGAEAIACGQNFSLAAINGKLFGAGQNSEGQLGLGDNSQRNVFTDTGLSV